MSDYEMKEIYPWLYSIQDPLDVFCYLIVGDDQALLFDTGYGVGNLTEAIRTVTSKPFVVVLGHGHIDHANGAYQFEKAYLHEGDFLLCRQHTSPEFRAGILEQYAASGMALPASFNTDAFCKAGMGNLEKLEVGRVFDLGGLHVEVISMPGHTAGSIGLLIQEKQTLLVSDSANSHIWMFLDESLSIKAYIRMLEKILELDFHTFFYGHGNQSLSKSEFQKYIRAARNASIEKAIPYDRFPELNPYIYEEDGAAIVFNVRTLEGE